MVATNIDKNGLIYMRQKAGTVETLVLVALLTPGDAIVVAYRIFIVLELYMRPGVKDAQWYIRAFTNNSRYGTVYTVHRNLNRSGVVVLVHTLINHRCAMS